MRWAALRCWLSVKTCALRSWASAVTRPASSWAERRIAALWAPEGAGQRRLVEGRIGGAALGLAQLVLELANSGLEVAHFTRDRLQMDADLVGVVTAFSQGREVHSGNLG